MEENKYCTIYLVRHGETENNVKRIMQGQIDSALTGFGKDQASKLAESLKDVSFDAIFSSDLSRARQTAEVVAISRKLAVNTTKLLRERHYGPYEGRPIDDHYSENKAMFDKLKTITGEERSVFQPYPEYETNEKIVGRMITFLREIAVTYLGKKVLAVSHGAIMKAFLVHLDFEKYKEASPGNTGYIKLLADGVDFFVEEVVNIPNKSIFTE